MAMRKLSAAALSDVPGFYHSHKHYTTDAYTQAAISGDRLMLPPPVTADDAVCVSPGRLFSR